MHVERQRDGECLLATVAALSGVTLRTVRKHAMNKVRETHPKTRDWNSIIDDRIFWDVMEYLKSKYHLKSLIPALEDVNSIQLNKLKGRKRLPKKGRGTVVIGQIFYGNLNGHICAFEDGRVYDSMNPKIGGSSIKEVIRNTGFGSKIQWVQKG